MLWPGESRQFEKQSGAKVEKRGASSHYSRGQSVLGRPLQPSKSHSNGNRYNLAITITCNN